MQRESMTFDVVIVGGGPAGLAAAIRLKQLALSDGRELSICLVEKGSAIGAHILSGTVFDARALAELIPDWQAQGAPLHTPVSSDEMRFLSANKSWPIPEGLVPACLHNVGHYLISLGELCQWLAQQAEALGVEIYPGFAAAELIVDANGAVAGVVTGDMGRNRAGEPGPNFQPGMELRAKYTLFAEGCRGHLGKQLEARFQLRGEADPQSYSLGIKEVWQVSAENFQPGRVLHTMGWPLPSDSYGGGFLYHYGENRVAVGYIMGLNYSNPYLSPFEEFQRFKTHPALRATLAGGKRLAFGARTLVAGGLQALPRPVFPGGALMGDEAGFLNPARLKGAHTAIKSGKLAAEAAFEALAAGRAQDELVAFPAAFRQSWLYDELFTARNFKPAMQYGLYLGSLIWGVDQVLLRGRAPWTLHNLVPDHAKLKPASDFKPIEYPKPDGVLSFDRAASIFLAGTHHDEDQPCHLNLREPALAISLNLAQYAAPEQRYCPAGVYEILAVEGGSRLQINAANCIHCKACDIKDPTQNITWVPPQGGEGPEYSGM